MAYRDYTQPVIHDEKVQETGPTHFSGYEKLSFLTRPLLF